MNLAVAAPQRVSDPGAPRLRTDVVVVLAAGLAACVATAVFVGRPWADLAVLGLAVFIGERLAMTLVDGTSLPLSYAVFLPLAVAVSPGHALVAVVGATATARLLDRDVPWTHHATAVGERVAAMLAVAASVWGAEWLLPGGGALVVLGGLTAGAGALLATELGLRRLRADGPFVEAGVIPAFFAVAASGVLMGSAYAGTTDHGGMGAWALAVFAVPALAARWASGRLHAIRRTYDQTIKVLAVVPEMSGHVRTGRSQRVSDLSIRVGRLLGLPRATLTDLERAALLHSLGHVTLDEPDPSGRPADASQVAGATVGVLRDGDHLSPPAELVAGVAGDEIDLSEDARLAAEILKASASFEDLAGGDPALARPALQYVASARGLVRDRRVVVALGRAVFGRAPDPVSSSR